MSKSEHERHMQTASQSPASLPPNDDDAGWAADSTGGGSPEQSLFPRRPWGLGAVLAAIVTALAILGLGLVVLALALGEDAAGSPLTFNVSLTVVVLVILATAWIFGPAIHGGGLASLGLRPSSTSKSSSWLLPPAVLVAVLVFNVVYVAIVNQLGIDWFIPEELPFDEFGPLALAISGFLVILAGPFAEEVFFRGFVLKGLSHRWRPLTGLLVSAAIFSIAHASLAIFIPIFVAGLLLGWLYLRTGSLWGSVWVHGAQNGVAFVAALTL